MVKQIMGLIGCENSDAKGKQVRGGEIWSVSESNKGKWQNSNIKRCGHEQKEKKISMETIHMALQ